MKRDKGPNLTLAEAGRLMGLTGSEKNVAQKAKRLLEAKERRIHRQIMLRAGGKGAGVRYLVTRWALLRWMPEYFDRRDAVAVSFQKFTTTFEERLAKQDALIEHLGDLIRDVLDEVEQMKSEREPTNSGPFSESPIRAQRTGG